MSYLGLIVITLILGFATQGYINHSYKKYSKVPIETGMTGAQAARKMLDDHGLQHVVIRRVSGELTDHYDPRSQTVNLSDGIYDGRSVSATAVACHECGHAVQHAISYLPMNIRTALVPVANFGSSAWLILLLAGVFLNIMGLVYLAIIFYCFAILFQVVTLPVEFNASHRAMDYIRSGAGCGVALSSQASSGALTVLRAAALTYVAAALTSVLQLLYYLSIFTNDR